MIHKSFTQILASHRLNMTCFFLLFFFLCKLFISPYNTGEFQQLWFKVRITLTLVTFFFFFNTSSIPIGVTLEWHFNDIADTWSRYNIGVKWEVSSCCGSNCTTTDVINICVCISIYSSFFYVWLDILHFINTLLSVYICHK